MILICLRKRETVRSNLIIYIHESTNAKCDIRTKAGTSDPKSNSRERKPQGMLLSWHSARQCSILKPSRPNFQLKCKELRAAAE